MKQSHFFFTRLVLCCAPHQPMRNALDNKRNTMQILIKAILSLSIILVATAIGKRLPSTAGLIGVMPLTGALVLVWMYLENR